MCLLMSASQANITSARKSLKTSLLMVDSQVMLSSEKKNIKTNA